MFVLTKEAEDEQVNEKYRQGMDSRPENELGKLASQNTPTRVIGLKLGRTPGAVQSQASKQGTSLKPTNQSPYNRRKK